MMNVAYLNPKLVKAINFNIFLGQGVFKWHWGLCISLGLDMEI